MSVKEKLSWALGHRQVSLADKAALVTLVAETDRHGRVRLDPEELQLHAGLSERALNGALHSLVDNNLIRGIRWSSVKGWSGEIRLNFEAVA